MRRLIFFFFQAEDGIRDLTVTGVQTCALPISCRPCAGPPRLDPLRADRAARPLPTSSLRLAEHSPAPKSFPGPRSVAGRHPETGRYPEPAGSVESLVLQTFSQPFVPPEPGATKCLALTHLRCY